MENRANMQTSIQKLENLSQSVSLTSYHNNAQKRERLRLEMEDEKSRPHKWENIKVICSNMNKSQRINKLYVLFLMVFMVCCLGSDFRKQKHVALIFAQIEMLCLLAFVFFFATKIVIWRSFKFFWLALDILTTLAGIVGYSLSFYHGEYEAERYVKAFRTLKLLLLIKEVNWLNEPASYLTNTLAKLLNILIPAFIIIYIYAVVGLSSFSNLEYSKCRDPANIQKTADWSVYSDSVFLCGERSCPTVGSVQFQCLNPIHYNVEPNNEELINMEQGNGLMHYENILYALLSTVKQTFVTGSSRLIILYKHSISPAYVYLYYYSYIYLISYIYLNIFYSLIITEGWDKENENNPKIVSLKICNVEDTSKSKNLQIVALSGSELNPGKQIPLSSIKKNCRKVKKINNPKAQDELESGIQLKKPKFNNIFENPNIEQIPDSLIGLQTKKQQQSNQESDKQAQITHQQKSKVYEIVSNVIIVLCCINLSLDYHGQDEYFKFIVDTIDCSFYLLMVIDIFYIICREKTSQSGVLSIYSKLEILVLLVCSSGLIYEAITSSTIQDFLIVSNPAQGVLRSLKYLRIMTLILRSTIFIEARLILEFTFKSLFNILNIIGLWFLIVIIFSVIGFHLHSYKTLVNDHGELDLQNGKSFQISFDGVYDSVIFTLLTFFNEEWDYIMFEQYLGAGPLVVVWQLMSITVGLVLFSKYFMAKLMMELDSLFDENKELTDFIENQEKKDKESESESSEAVSQSENPKLQDKRISFSVRNSIQLSDVKQLGAVNTNPRKKSYSSSSEMNGACCRKIFERVIRKLPGECRKIVDSKVFKVIFVLFVLLSCSFLIMITPLVDRNADSSKTFIIIDYLCKVYFFVFVVLSMIGHGVYQSDSSYFRKSFLNWVNLLILIVEVAVLFVPDTNNEILLKVEKLKVLRVLYFIELRKNSDWNMKITLLSLMELLPKIFTLLTVTLVMYSFFALILVKIYKDNFYSCVNSYENSTIVTKDDCLNWGGDWISAQINTSNILNSILYLFLVATTEGWITMMTPMMNEFQVGYEPVVDSNKYISIFFMFFFFFGNLIMLNVFVGLSISNFKRLKEKVTGESKLSTMEKLWLDTKTQIYKLQPVTYIEKPQNLICGAAFVAVNHVAYKIAQGICFITFMVAMSLRHSNMNQQLEMYLNYIQISFACILAIEYTLEFLAFRIRIEEKKSFIFKSLVLLYSITYVLLHFLASINSVEEQILLGVFVSLQSIRYLALLDDMPSTEKLLNSLLSVLPQTFNIMMLGFCILFIYTIIGMELFAFLRPNSQLDVYNQNYTNFSSAMFALVKFSTMESPIQQITDAAQELSPNFVCSQVYTYSDYIVYGQTSCGNKFFSYIFFLSFHIFYSLLLMSTLMAIIADSYNQVKREEEGKITKFVLKKVQKAWSKFDKEASGFISYREFWMFTAQLLEIYLGTEKGIADTRDEAENQFAELVRQKQKFLKSMEIPIYENKNGGALCFQFNEVIQALTKSYLKNEFGHVKSKKADKIFKQRQSQEDIDFIKSSFTSSHVATMMLLKSGLRIWKKKCTDQNSGSNYKNLLSKYHQQKK